MSCTTTENNSILDCIDDYGIYQSDCDDHKCDGIDTLYSQCGYSDPGGDNYQVVSTTCWSEWWEAEELSYAEEYCDALESVADKCDGYDGYSLCTSCFDTGTACVDLTTWSSTIELGRAIPVCESGTPPWVTRPRWPATQCAGCEDTFGFMPWDFSASESEICCDVGSAFWTCPEGMDCTFHEDSVESDPYPASNDDCEEEYDSDTEWKGDDHAGIDGTGCDCKEGLGDWTGADQGCIADFDIDIGLGDGADGGEILEDASEDEDPTDDDDGTGGGGDDFPEPDDDDGECNIDTDCDVYADPDNGIYYSCISGICIQDDPEHLYFMGGDEGCIEFYSIVRGGLGNITDDDIKYCFGQYTSACESIYCAGTDLVDVNATGFENTTGCCKCVEAFKCMEGLWACDMGGEISQTFSWDSDTADGAAWTATGAIFSGMSHCVNSTSFYDCIYNNPCAWATCAETYLGADHENWGYDYSDAAAMTWAFLDDLDSASYNFEGEDEYGLRTSSLDDCEGCATTTAHGVADLYENDDGSSEIQYTCECATGYAPIDGLNPSYDEGACVHLYASYEAEFEETSGTSSGWWRIDGITDAAEPANEVYDTLPIDWRFRARGAYTSLEDTLDATNVDVEVGDVSLVYEKLATVWDDDTDDTVDVRIYQPVVNSTMGFAGNLTGIPRMTTSYSSDTATANISYTNGPAPEYIYDVGTTDAPTPEIEKLKSLFGVEEGRVGTYGTAVDSADEISDILSAQIDTIVTNVVAGIGTTEPQTFTFKKIIHTPLDKSMLSVFDAEDTEGTTTQVINVATTMTTSY